MHGATFKKCDFQVHTPRDRQFAGAEYVTEDERRHYSARFIAACREKGLDAVAITDHHDLWFYRYIQEAANSETISEGQNRVAIFPGMELTLNVPCQAIVVFDSNMQLPDDLIVRIYAVLGIDSYSQLADSKTSETKRLSLENIDEVAERLASLPELKERFILFPNIREGGKDTILREGGHLKYANGHFIGGYLDNGQYAKHKDKEGWRNIVEGRVQAYGNRAVAIFQTSDCRSEAFEELGKHFTFVKLAEYTAEGLRQACLAKDSRIRQERPPLPPTYLSRITVAGSKVIGDVSIDANRELNALIGGRGVGKSSLIQYMLFALGKENEPTKSEVLSFAQNTLENAGYVQLHIIKNDVEYTVRRDKYAHTVKVGSTPAESTNGAFLSDMIQVEAFLQKELSKHGADRRMQVLQMLRYSIKDQINEIESELGENKNTIKSLMVELAAFEQYKGELQSLRSTLSAKTEEAEAIKSGLAETTEEDRKTIAEYSVFQREKQVFEGLIRNIEQEKHDLESALESVIPTRMVAEEYIHKDAIGTAVGHYADIWKRYRDAIPNLISFFSSKPIQDLYSKLTDEYSKNEQAYGQVTAKATEQRQAIENLKDAEDSISQTRRRMQEIERLLGQITVRWSDLFKSFAKRGHLINALHGLQEAEAIRLSGTTEGEIGISFCHNVDYQKYEIALNEIISNARNQKERLREAFSLNFDRSQSVLPIYKFLFCVYRSISEGKDLHDLFEKHGFDDSSISEADRSRIIESVSLDSLIEIAFLIPDPNPKLVYHKGNGHEIAFGDASYGQQSSALLSMLLRQKKGPLIIDQPEDDLDNRIISAFSGKIVQTKQNRQLIFATHNANIVVNADSELVAVLEFDESTKKCSVSEVGAIDCKGIRQGIKDIMEGGEKAFALRREKYGF